MQDREQNIMLIVCMAGVVEEAALTLLAMRPDFPSLPRLIIMASVALMVVIILRGLAGRTPQRKTSMVVGTAMAVQMIVAFATYPG